MLPASLTASVVTYRPDQALLARCLGTLAQAIARARREGVVRTVAVALIDNSEDAAIGEAVVKLAEARFADSGVQMTGRHGHANVGYGVAHNLMLHGTGADYQLVMNPDVELAPDALARAIRWLDIHPEVGAVAPAITRPDGSHDYLCRRYPSVLDLFVRGFLPAPLRRPFAKRLARYELRDRIDPSSAEPVVGIPLLSGCCMLARRQAIDATGGFDPRFFLYFEDYDWSMRLARVAENAYLPMMRAVHHGGGAARKGGRHVRMFVKSGWRFFNKHGWRWL